MASTDRGDAAAPLVGLPEPGDGVVTWRRLREHAEEVLTDAGSASAVVDARRIVEEAAGCEPAELLLVLDDAARTAGVASYQRMVSRRAAGEPLQYVLGRWGFRTLDLAVDRRALIPRPETEVVAGIAIDAVRRRSEAGSGAPRAVDLGTGTGAIGLSIAAEVPAAEVWITDVSPDALALARANLVGIGRAGTRVRVAEGSWFAALPAELAGTLAVVVSNPPYIADGEELPEDVDRWEPRPALRSGPTGTECYEWIVADAPRWLAPGGELVLEVAPHQADVVTALAERAGAVEVTRGEDLAGRMRWVRARFPGPPAAAGAAPDPVR